MKTLWLPLLLLCRHSVECITSTSCYGPKGINCNAHQLSCGSSSLIYITNATYVYRSGCDTGIGIVECVNCCRGEPGDCLRPYKTVHVDSVKLVCSGKQKCSIGGERKADGDCDGMRYSAYSKIEYDCVQEPSASTQKGSSNIGAIIGGIIGGLLVIVSVVIAVFLFKRRKKVKETQNTMTIRVIESPPEPGSTLPYSNINSVLTLKKKESFDFDLY